MSCSYCKRAKNLMHGTHANVSVCCRDGVSRIYYSEGYYGGSTEPIKFCPMCGEQFPEVVHDSFESIKEDMVLNVCEYAKKRGIGAGDFECKSCKWESCICTNAMRKDLANRLGKLLDKEDER